jgi:phage tail-like protein
MAVQRDHPYGNFNFLVDLGGGDTEGSQAGFSEIVLPDAEISVIEYRNGGDKESGSIKLPGRQHYGNVILKRGVTGALNLYQWWNAIRNGDASARRTVSIMLQNEDRGAIVMTWKLLRAWPAKYTGPHLLGKGNDVAIETLELAFERLELE